MRLSLRSLLPLALMFMGCDFFGFGAEGSDAGPGMSVDAGSDAAVTDADASSDASSNATLDMAQDAVSGPHTYACEAVRSSDSPILSLTSFEDVLYMGLRGSNTDNLVIPMLGSTLGTGLRGATSVCAMTVYQGQLYANTSSRGEIYRSSDGRNWRQVYPGGVNLQDCDLEEFEGSLYALNQSSTGTNGYILRSRTGSTFTQTWSNAVIGVGALSAYGGRLYALGGSGQQGIWLDSATGAGWRQSTTPGRFVAAREFAGALYMTATEVRSTGPAGIYRFTGGTPQSARLVADIPERGATALKTWDGALFAGTEGDSTGSRLLISRDGDRFETLCDFEQTAVWALEVHLGGLYVGTADDENGQLYRVSITGDL